MHDPKNGDTIIQYTLRCAADLLSPPKHEGENNEMKCDDAAQEIRDLERKVKMRWDRYKADRHN